MMADAAHQRLVWRVGDEAHIARDGGLAASLLVSACGGGGAPAVTGTAAADQPEVVITLEPEPDVTSSPIAMPSKYADLSKRAWQKLVKNPDAYLGKGYKIWACIWQFDAATGDDGFLGYASYRREDYWAVDGASLRPAHL
jgi:hypothetical protein